MYFKIKNTLKNNNNYSLKHLQSFKNKASVRNSCIFPHFLVQFSASINIIIYIKIKWFKFNHAVHVAK